MVLCAKTLRAENRVMLGQPNWIRLVPMGLVNWARQRTALVCRRSIRVLRAGGRRLIAAASRIAGTDVTAVASAVCKVHIRERLLRRDVRCIDAIAEQVVRRN